MNAFNFDLAPYIRGRRVFISGIAAFVIGILVGSLLWSLGGVPRFPTPPPTSTGPSTISYNSEYLGRGAFSAVVPEVTIEINVSQYKLPIDLNEVTGYAELKAWFGITAEQEELLSENGFVVLRVNQFESLVDVYDCIIDNGLPLLITTDAVLHSYHVLFDETLKRAEMNELISKMNRTIETLLSEAQRQVQKYEGTSIEDAANINFMYLEVAHSLISPEFSPTSQKATQELELIRRHDDIVNSPIFGYKEDYSQYVPRGHYRENERLKAYFKTMMWLGRMRFSLLPNPPYIHIDDVMKQTRAAILLTWMVQKTNVYHDWMRVYDVTKFFVGVSDDLTFEDYLAVLDEMSIDHPEQLHGDNLVAELVQKLVQRSKAKILGTYAEIYPWMPQEKELERVLNETSGLRFMGRRFIPDSYMFQQLVFPQVGTFSWPRLFPKSLDIPAVLGSKTAEEILNKTEAHFLNYTVQLNKLRLEFQDLSVENWTRNLYWSWLYTLNTTLESVPSTYPAFMTTKPWSYEKLETFAGSWTELRHDTILYAKQSYTYLDWVPPPPPNTAYVEPYPQAYRRLTGLLNMTLNGLEELQLLSEDMGDSIRDFREILGLFFTASILELKGEDLSQDMQEEIREAAGKFTTILGVASEKTQKATIVADVHTVTGIDPPRALEEALGKFNILVIVYSDDDGNLFASAGPAYNYFEFRQPIAHRLTDEAWAERLATDPPQQPDWTSEFAA